MLRVIGIGEMSISTDINDTIKTFALASCVGVTVYSSVKKVGGMIHIALPTPSRIEKSNTRCCYYASTGIPTFINTICKEYGCYKSEIILNIFGGANSIMKDDAFCVGKKNVEITKRILKELNLNINISETGGTVSRTIALSVATGEINIEYQKITI